MAGASHKKAVVLPASIQYNQGYQQGDKW